MGEPHDFIGPHRKILITLWKKVIFREDQPGPPKSVTEQMDAAPGCCPRKRVRGLLPGMQPLRLVRCTLDSHTVGSWGRETEGHLDWRGTRARRARWMEQLALKRVRSKFSALSPKFVIIPQGKT